MSQTIQEKNKALVLDAFDTLFNKRDYAAAEKYWSPNYIQHSAHIEPGRDGLFNLIRSAPDTLRYEYQLIVAEDDDVIVHGRFSGNGRPVAWIAADIVRIENGHLGRTLGYLTGRSEQSRIEERSADVRRSLFKLTNTN
jgi:predicted SnoaL-like aldol condensation-catalyzing enzyme